MFRYNILLEYLPGEEPGALPGHGLDPGDVLVRDLTPTQLAQVVRVLLHLLKAAGDHVPRTIQNGVRRLLCSVSRLQLAVLMYHSVNLRSHDL